MQEVVDARKRIKTEDGSAGSATTPLPAELQAFWQVWSEQSIKEEGSASQDFTHFNVQAMRSYLEGLCAQLAAAPDDRLIGEYASLWS